MALDQLLPGPIAQLGGFLGRADDVGEQHGGKDAIEFGFLGLERNEESIDVEQRRFRVPGRTGSSWKIAPGMCWTM